jgi:hypothetical protein
VSDLVFVLGVVGFFAAAALFVAACSLIVGSGSALDDERRP